MATQDNDLPTSAASGAPCATCGTPLAADQRFCLACGTRRAGLAAPDPRPVPPPAAPPAAEILAPRAASSTASFLAGLGCLLLALGVGVLIGRSGRDAPATATTPPLQVIRVGAAPAASGAATTPATPKTTPAKPKASAKAKARAKATAPARAAKPSKRDLQKLDKLSPEQYQKQSRKLPKQLVTPGKPPPVDKSKPAGGGSGFQEIG